MNHIRKVWRNVRDVKKEIRMLTCLYVRDVKNGFAMSTAVEIVHHATTQFVIIVFQALIAENTNIVVTGIVNTKWCGIVKGVVVGELAIVNTAMRTVALVIDPPELRGFLRAVEFQKQAFFVPIQRVPLTIIRGRMGTLE